jgi:hypothetical protein
MVKLPYFEEDRESYLITDIREKCFHSIDDILAAIAKNDDYHAKINKIWQGYRAPVMVRMVRRIIRERANKKPSSISGFARMMNMDRATGRRLLSQLEADGYGRFVMVGRENYFRFNQKFRDNACMTIELYMNQRK